MKRRPILIALVCSVLLATLVVAQDSVLAEVESLWRQARYGEAADLVSGTPAGSTELAWWEARLTTDPARFQELALMVGQDPATAGTLEREAALARAREHFAAGRYQSAEGLLRPYASGNAAMDPAARLWWGMSLQATGEARAAAQALESIASDAPEYGLAQALLADLNLRAQRPRRARTHAEAALAADHAVGAIALGVLEQLARAEGDADASRDISERLARDYPRSVELTWIRSVVPESATLDESEIVVAEESSGPRRTFALQYGAFQDRALGLRRIRQLERDVADLKLEVDREQSPALYRVVGGSFGTRAQAERARDALAARGIEAFILAPGR